MTLPVTYLSLHILSSSLPLFMSSRSPLSVWRVEDVEAESSRCDVKRVFSGITQPKRGREQLRQRQKITPITIWKLRKIRDNAKLSMSTGYTIALHFYCWRFYPKATYNKCTQPCWCNPQIARIMQVHQLHQILWTASNAAFRNKRRPVWTDEFSVCDRRSVTFWCPPLWTQDSKQLGLCWAVAGPPVRELASWLAIVGWCVGLHCMWGEPEPFAAQWAATDSQCMGAV